MSALIDESKTVRNGVLTLREAAEVLRCSKAHVSNIINRKVPGLPTLPVVRIVSFRQACVAPPNSGIIFREQAPDRRSADSQPPRDLGFADTLSK